MKDSPEPALIAVYDRLIAAVRVLRRRGVGDFGATLSGSGQVNTIVPEGVVRCR